MSHPDDQQDPPEPTAEEELEYNREREQRTLRRILKEFQARLFVRDAAAGLTLQWLTNEEYGYQFVKLEQCEIHLSRRNWYCDRGAWDANVYPVDRSELSLSLDYADGFPRYYFDETRAKLEMECWAKKRKLV